MELEWEILLFVIIIIWIFRDRVFKLKYLIIDPQDEFIQEVVNQIWETYNVDNTDGLENEEAERFIQDTLGYNQFSFEEFMGL